LVKAGASSRRLVTLSLRGRGIQALLPSSLPPAIAVEIYAGKRGQNIGSDQSRSTGVWPRGDELGGNVEGGDAVE
jgi:hypothetical protein